MHTHCLAHPHTHKHARIDVHKRARLYTRTHIHTHTLTYTHTHTHTHTKTHTHKMWEAGGGQVMENVDQLLLEVHLSDWQVRVCGSLGGMEQRSKAVGSRPQVS